MKSIWRRVRFGMACGLCTVSFLTMISRSESALSATADSSTVPVVQPASSAVDELAEGGSISSLDGEAHGCGRCFGWYSTHGTFCPFFPCDYHRAAHTFDPEAANYSEGNGWHPTTDEAGFCGIEHPLTCACLCINWDIECTQECNGDLECLAQCAAEYTLCLENCEGESYLGFSEEASSVLAAIWSGRMDVQSVARKYRNVELNAERAALQVLGCNETVLAHIPLPATALTEVE